MEPMRVQFRLVRSRYEIYFPECLEYVNRYDDLYLPTPKLKRLLKLMVDDVDHTADRVPEVIDWLCGYVVETEHDKDRAFEHRRAKKALNYLVLLTERMK